MATPSNLPVAYSDIEPQIFDNQFGNSTLISDNSYAALIGLLEKRAVNRLAAENLAAGIIKGLSQTNIDIDVIMDQLRKSSTIEIDATLAYFLNITRVGTSYLGLAGQNLTNPYVQRTILP